MEKQEKKKTVSKQNSENTTPKKKKKPAEHTHTGSSENRTAVKKVKKRPPQFKETGSIPTKEIIEKLAESEKVKKKNGTKKSTNDTIKKTEKSSVEQPNKKSGKKNPANAKKSKPSVKNNESAQHNMDNSNVSVPDTVDKEAGGEGKSKESLKKFIKWFFLVIGSLVGIAAAVYLAISIFFIWHFYYGTTINGIDYSLKTVKYVEADTKRQAEEYVLTIEEKLDKTETISGTDISLEYQDTNAEEVLKSQNPFLWPIVFFEPEEAVEEMSVSVSYDKAALDKKVMELKCITDTLQTEPTSAYPRFNGEKFEPAKEQTGFKVDTAAMKAAVNDHVSRFQSVMNMEESGGYALPKYLSDSPEVIAACDAMNEYCKASITYTFGEETEVVDAKVIYQWLSYDEELNVTFDPEKVREFMVEFGKRHDTVGSTRTITTPTGKETKVEGGTYGWSVDEEKETEALIAHVQNGDVTTKEPAYAQTAVSHDEQDWGTTYIEVDLTTQHMWYIADGEVKFEADVVTGTPIPSRITPQGVYDILEKLRNKVLRGTRYPDGTYEYESPVSYWMRVTYTGIGFHDATWQPWFGGNRYQRNGSHGCINMSYRDAATLYEMIPVRVPVVIHY